MTFNYEGYIDEVGGFFIKGKDLEGRSRGLVEGTN
jgi:hypothetical protein